MEMEAPFDGLLLQYMVFQGFIFLYVSKHGTSPVIRKLKVARYSFSGPIPPKFEHKLRRHKQSFRKIATTAVLDEDENLL